MFKITNWGAEITNAKSILGGICYYRYFNENNNDITASGYFPATLGLKEGDNCSFTMTTEISGQKWEQQA